MIDTLILFKPLAEFGEALKKECPNNDCTIYRDIYKKYCEEYADYKRIKEALPDLSKETVRVLEHAIRAGNGLQGHKNEGNGEINDRNEAQRMPFANSIGYKCLYDNFGPILDKNVYARMRWRKMRCIPYTGCMVRKISMHSEVEKA